MVLTPKGMYVIEIKSHPGVIRGDTVNWVWERPLPKRGQKIFDNPRLLARRKAQKLASLLKLQPSFHLSKETVPFIDALVLLSAEDLVIKLEGDARQGIVSRQELLREITLIDEDWRHRQITAYRRVTNTARQVAQHLRSEQNVTRAFIEGGYGFSVRLTNRIRDIKNAIDRLKRLHEKLGLLQLTRSDRALRGKLIDVLLDAVSHNRFALDEMIGRLDWLSLTVRKRSKMRQVAQAVDAHLQAGGVIDLEPLLERLDAAVWAGAAPFFPGGSAFCDVNAGENLERLELLIASLPEPKVKTAPAAAVQERESRIALSGGNQEKELEKPFVRAHLEVMLRELIATGKPQSATAYWQDCGDPDIPDGIWLYAPDGYAQLQAAFAKFNGKELNYCLVPTLVPHSRFSADRRVLKLTLDRMPRR